MLASGLYLAGLWPPFRAAVTDYLLPWVEYIGAEGRIVSGYRSMAEQTRLYAIGRTPQEIAQRVAKQGRGGAVTDAWPGSSAHNYGLAIDVEGPGQQVIVALGRSLGFGTVSWDPAHLEWPNWTGLLR